MHIRKMTLRLGTLLAAAAATTALVMVTATPAQAVSAQAATTKTIALPKKPDVKITITLGVWRPAAGEVSTDAHVSWEGTKWWIGGKRFNSIILDLQLKKGSTIVARASCNLTTVINDHEDGYVYCPVIRKLNLPQSDSRVWSTDGTVAYDTASDGQGTYKWNLTATPKIANRH